MRCPVYPSESGEKVSEAVRRIFPDMVLERTAEGFLGTTDSMESFMDQIRRQKILDSTRSVLLRRASEGRTWFCLNKQAAFAGKVSFAEEDTVLGAIRVVVEDDDIDALIDRIAPSTVNGEEIF